LAAPEPELAEHPEWHHVAFNVAGSSEDPTSTGRSRYFRTANSRMVVVGTVIRKSKDVTDWMRRSSGTE